MFGVQHKPPESNSPPAPPSGWPGGTRDILWTCSGTIAPPQTPICDQPPLSISLYARPAAIHEGVSIGAGTASSP